MCSDDLHCLIRQTILLRIYTTTCMYVSQSTNILYFLLRSTYNTVLGKSAMTISYSDTFIKLLARWKGSLWKSIWRDLFIFLGLYYAINMTYRFGDWTPAQRQRFKKVADYCEKESQNIPLQFLLGFFVASVVGRWWSQCNWVSWPDRFMIHVTTYIRGSEYAICRRTVARWCNLMSVLCWRNLSIRTIKRFPTIDHLVAAGLMTEQELKTYQTTEAPHGKWWLPAVWIANLLMQARDKNAIDPIQLRELMSQLMEYRGGFGTLIIYDWVTIPLVYTQVVAIATYGYFGVCLMGRQITGIGEPDLYIPFFTILQFLFYMGWFKVGEDLMNPFGEDDDDFEMNYILDRNIQIAYMMADDVHGQIPQLQQDLYWGQRNPMIPHTRASIKRRDKIFAGHLTRMKLNDDEMSQASAEELASPTGRLQSLVVQFSQRRVSSAIATGSGDRRRFTSPVLNAAQLPTVATAPARVNSVIGSTATTEKKKSTVQQMRDEDEEDEDESMKSAEDLPAMTTTSSNLR